MQKTDLELLTEGRDLLSDPRRFVQRHFAIDKFGQHAGYLSQNACAFCSLGALYNRNGDTYGAATAHDILRRAAERVLIERSIDPESLLSPSSPIIYVNDILGYEATLKMWAYAIEEASGTKSECAA